MGGGGTAPKVSVIMAVHNGGEFLGQAIESVLCQSLADLEFIVVDDGSTDNAPETLASYDDPRLIVLRNERNIGLTRSLNRALNAARGRYIARMDADDISARERLERQAQYLDSYPDVGAVASWVLRIDEQGRVLYRWRVPCDDSEIKRILANGKNPLPHGAMMLRRELLEQVGGYREWFRYAQDYDLWLRMMAAGVGFGAVPEYLYRMRWRRDMQTIINRPRQTMYMRAAYFQWAGRYETTPAAEVEEAPISSAAHARALYELARRLYNWGADAFPHADRLLMASLRKWLFDPRVWLWAVRRAAGLIPKPKLPADSLRVLMFTRRFHRAGGGDTFFTLVARELYHAGHDVTVVTAIPWEPDNQYPRLLTQAGVPVMSIYDKTKPFLKAGDALIEALALPLKGLSAAAKAVGAGRIAERLVKPPKTARSILRRIAGWWVFRRIARRRDVQVIHVLGANSVDGIRWANWLGVPAVYTAIADAKNYPPMPTRFEEWGPRLSAMTALAESIIPPFREVWNYHGPATCVRSCVAPPCTVPEPEDRAWIGIGLLARFSYEKAIPNLIRAVHALLQRGCDVRLILAGDGPEKPKLESLVAELGISDHVTFTFVNGPDELAGFMRRIDIYAMSSDTEGMPLSIVEAMAYGKPTVCTDVGGVHEVVDDGKTGILVPPGDVDALAGALQKLVDDEALREKMGRAAYERYLARHTPKVARDGMLAVLRQVCATPA